MIMDVWMLPCFIALCVMPETGEGAGPWARFAVLTLVCAHPNTYAQIASWSSMNSNSVRTRALGAAVTVGACSMLPLPLPRARRPRSGLAHTQQHSTRQAA